MIRPCGRATCGSRAVPSARRALTAPVALLLLLLASAAACGSDTATGSADRPPDDGRTGRNPSGCVDQAGARGDLFPDKFEISHADNLDLTYHDTYKVLTVGEPAPDVPAQRYVLVQCGSQAPALDGELAGATVVEVPVRSLFSESTSHLGFVDELGIEDVVAGVSNSDVVVTPGVRQQIDAGAVTTFAEDYEVNTELVIAEGPDVFVTGGTEDPAHQVLDDAAVPVVANAEWLETSPLGWAEWIGFLAALTNTEARATGIFQGIETRYQAAAALAADVAERPRVITGGLYEGDWNARGGAGIVPRFVADAGGDYVYADDTSTGSLVLDVEQVLAEALDADVWIGPLGFTSRAEAEDADSRYTQFAAWDAGGVWSTTRQQDEAGGNAYYDQGPVQPDQVLLDLIAILHPELAGDHELAFYEQVPER
jgi:iron complex transport system substrate-binding protein